MTNRRRIKVPRGRSGLRVLAIVALGPAFLWIVSSAFGAVGGSGGRTGGMGASSSSGSLGAATTPTTPRSTQPGVSALEQTAPRPQSAPAATTQAGVGASNAANLTNGPTMQTGTTGGILGIGGFGIRQGGGGGTPTSTTTGGATAGAGGTNPPNTASSTAGSTNSNPAPAAGVSIASVAPGSLAAEAGVQPGDRLLAVNNQAVNSPADLERALLAGGRTEQPVTIRLLRNGAEQTLPLPKESLQRLLAAQQAGVPDGEPGGRALGVLLDPAAFPRAVVREVKPGSPAALAGLQPGDQILTILGQPIQSAEQVRRAVTVARLGENLPLTYRRGDRQFEAAIPLASYATVFGGSSGSEHAAQRAQGPALGVRVAQDSGGGVVVTAVQQDSPAAMAGIRVGDQIVSARGTTITTPEALASIVEQAGIGNHLDLRYRHQGSEFRATPRLGSYAELFGRSRALQGEQPSIGMRVRENPTGESVISAIVPNGPAAKAGLQPGDVIQAVNGQAVRSPMDVVAGIQQAGIGQSVQIRYQRGTETREATAPVQEFAVAYGMQQGVEHQVARPPSEPTAGQTSPSPPAQPSPAPAK